MLRPEDFDSRFSALAAGLDDLAAEALAGDLAEPGDGPTPATRTREALRSYLEDEIVPAVQQQGNLGVQDAEIRREQMKRALAHLKLSVLRGIARDRGVTTSGDLDRITDQIATAFQWDREAIARLILDHTEESPEVDTGHLTRIFTLRDSVDLGVTADRLSYVSGRYIRTGIARWFIFGNSGLVEPVLRIRGAVDAYRAEARESEESAFLEATATSAKVDLELLSDTGVVLVHGASAQDARASLVALKTAAKIDVRDYVPRAELGAAIVPRSIHPTSLFMLDLVYSRLQGHLFRERNPILARFRYTKTATQSGTAERRPTLRAVRFDGEHLLDSREACSLLWLEGRPLVDLTLRVRAYNDHGHSWGRFVVRFTVETDHVSVATSFGTAPVEQSQQLHSAAVAAVQRALVGPEADWEQLGAVEEHIKEVASSDAAPETAILLRDPDDDTVDTDG